MANYNVIGPGYSPAAGLYEPHPTQIEDGLPFWIFTPGEEFSLYREDQNPYKRWRIDSPTQGVTLYQIYQEAGSHTDTPPETGWEEYDASSPPPTVTLAGGGADTTAPRVLSHIIPASGGYIDVTLSEPIAAPTTFTGFTVKVNGVARTISSTSRLSDIVIRLTFDSVVYQGEVVTISYTGTDVEDIAGNKLAAFTSLVSQSSAENSLIQVAGGAGEVVIANCSLTASLPGSVRLQGNFNFSQNMGGVVKSYTLRVRRGGLAGVEVFSDSRGDYGDSTGGNQSNISFNFTDTPTAANQEYVVTIAPNVGQMHSNSRSFSLSSGSPPAVVNSSTVPVPPSTEPTWWFGRREI